ncbi:CKLF-like MARVEL transmembrane domain-containing protein 4 [Bradysia coprophila]|uniref:CKLF-like MARVEL transmembrane domain-containing protein 4 n=1 Tax=Bradysia coprophila TaxID=38358 RepID=UPI00187DD699|nr:CKLF-like MARVEL transmembrane domain-containing protein 4 [Bradysia coprophila]
MMSETVVTVDPNRQPQAQPKPAAQSQGALSWVKFNIGYFQTIPGILKLVQLVFGIICMACASPAYIGASHWFLFVAVTSFIATLLWSFVYLLGIREVLNLAINWILTELLNTGIATIFYIIAFIVQLATWSNIHPGSSLQYFRASNIAAGCFGLFNTIAYAASTYFLYLEHKSASTP